MNTTKLMGISAKENTDDCKAFGLKARQLSTGEILLEEEFLTYAEAMDKLFEILNENKANMCSDRPQSVTEQEYIDIVKSRILRYQAITIGKVTVRIHDLLQQ